MITIVYTPSFLRDYNQLLPTLQEEVLEKISLFQQNPRHPFLKTHKLHGRMRGRFSFFVNYKYRIVFVYDAKNIVALLAVGDHDVYR